MSRWHLATVATYDQKLLVLINTADDDVKSLKYLGVITGYIDLKQL